MNKQVLVIEDKTSFDRWFKGWQQKNAHVSNALPAAGGGAISLQGGDIGAGKALFAQKCTACHKLAPFDQTLVGPGLLRVLHDPVAPEPRQRPSRAIPPTWHRSCRTGTRAAWARCPTQPQTDSRRKDIANLVAFLNT